MRVILALFLLSGSLFSQIFPAFNWIQKVGSGKDLFAGLGTDALGNTYLAGSTTAANFPVKSTAQSALAGGSDIYVAKLDPSGNVVFATYFAGSGDDTASAMAVDALGNVYVTGQTSSPDFPATKGVFQPTPPRTAPRMPLPGRL